MATRTWFAAALLCAAAARGEERFGKRGQVVPYGGFGYAHDSSNGQTTNSVSVAPGAMWFFADGFAAGMQAGFSWRSGSVLSISGVIFPTPDTTTTLNLAPVVAAALPLGERLTLFPQLSAGFSWSWAGGGTAHGIEAEIFAPIVFTPVEHLFLGFGPFFATVIEGSSPSSGNKAFGLQSQIGGWFQAAKCEGPPVSRRALALP